MCHGISSGLRSVPMGATTPSAALAAPEPKELLSVAVPTTLQGTHDGCGGSVVFRPAIQRRELLEGRAVVLSAACTTCGATLSTEWAMPNAAELAREHARATLEVAYIEDDVHELPLPADVGSNVPQLGAWRMRDEAPATQRTAFEPQVAQSSLPETQSMDPALVQHVSDFSARIEAARNNLRRMSTELPAALALESTGESFRAPQLARREGLPDQALSASPSGFAIGAASTALAAEAEPALDLAVAAPAVARAAAPSFIPVPAVDIVPPASAIAAIEAAIGSPSFGSDTLIGGGAVALEAPGAEIAAAVPVELPITETAPTYELPAPIALAPPAPIAPEAVAPQLVASEPIAPSMPEPIALATPEAPMALAASRIPLDVAPAALAPVAPTMIAPTDVDVFPPDVSALPVAGAEAAPFAFTQSLPAADTAANVWGELPITATNAPAAQALVAPAEPTMAPAEPMLLETPFATAPPAPCQPEALMAPAMMAAPSVPGPDPATATFARAVAEAAVLPAPQGAMPLTSASVAPHVPVSSDLGGAFHAPEHPVALAMPAQAHAAQDVNDALSIDTDRGFDWGGDEAAGTRPKRAKRAKAAKESKPARGKRGRRIESSGAMPVQAPVAVAIVGPEPAHPELAAAAAAPDATPGQRARIGVIPLAVVVLLAAIVGITTVQIYQSNSSATNGTPASPATTKTAPAAAPVIPAPNGRSVTSPGAATPKAATPATPSAPPAVPKAAGTEVSLPADAADAGTSLGAAADGAGQVPATPADTSDASATGTDDSNPFAASPK